MAADRKCESCKKLMHMSPLKWLWYCAFCRKYLSA